MDKLSEKLLKLLYTDCTLNAQQLAALCGVSADEIEEKKKALEAQGIILGYKATVNWEKAESDDVEALIEVKLIPQRDKGFDRIAERIYNFPEVESCYLMSGSYDLAVIIRGTTLRKVADFVAEKLSVIDGVTATGTHFILKKYKEQNVIFEKREEKVEELIFV